MSALIEFQEGVKLKRYDSMCRAIDKCFEVDELATMERSAAMLEAAARIAQNTEAEDRAHEIRRRAGIKANAVYDSQEKAGGPGVAGPGRGKTGQTSRPVSTLAEIGVTKQDMHEWRGDRKLAEKDPEGFEAALTQGRKAFEQYKKPKASRSEESAAALWVWGRLMDFERNGLLDLKPSKVRNELADHQLDDIRRLLPKVTKWLNTVRGA